MGIYEGIVPEHGAVLNIVDYSLIDREIIVPKDGGAVTLGKPREKDLVKTISDLISILGAIASTVRRNILDSGVYIGGIELNDYFTAQLVFDILHDKYLTESPQLTLGRYCKYYVSFAWDKSLDFESDNYTRETAINTVAKMMSTELNYESEIKIHDRLINDAELFGVNLARYFWYFDRATALNEELFAQDKTKPKYFWDYIYYNGNSKLITYKQFRRSFRVGKHYSYDDFIEGFKTYDRFVGKFMSDEQTSDRVKFLKSMDFYNLEIYKRLDFIYKLAVRMEKEDLYEISQNHPMIKRFHPQVDFLYIDNDKLLCDPRVKYYRPFLFVENVCPEINSHQLSAQTESLLVIYYIIRAKTYELFRYKFRFVSDDYMDIWNFIGNQYDVLSYHNPNKEWINAAESRKRDQVKRIKNAITINDALFWESEVKQRPYRRERPDKRKIK